MKRLVQKILDTFGYQVIKKPMVDIRKISLRPKRSLKYPTLAVIAALPMTNAIMTHATWSMVAEKAPCIWGRATVTEFQVNA